jgi:hypothetical protein
MFNTGDRDAAVLALRHAVLAPEEPGRFHGNLEKAWKWADPLVVRMQSCLKGAEARVSSEAGIPLGMRVNALAHSPKHILEATRILGGVGVDGIAAAPLLTIQSARGSGHYSQ